MDIIADLIKSSKITDPASPKGVLLLAAAHLFRTQGYDRTTVRDLAKAIGIQSGSLFHHFKTKEDILAAVMRETLIVCTERMRRAASAASSPQAKLQALIKCEIQSILGDRGDGLGVLVFEWKCLTSRKRTQVLNLRSKYEAIWLEALQDAHELGLLTMEPAVLRRFLTGALSWIVNWYNPKGHLDITSLSDLALRLVIKNN